MLLLALACAAPGSLDTGPAWDPSAWAPPAPEDLPEQVEPPDPFLSFFDKVAIDSPALWQELRRPELELLLAHYAYGELAARPAVAVTVAGSHPAALEGAADLVELDVVVVEGAGALRLLVVLPAGAAAPPVVLGLDKCGNHSVIADERVALPTGPVPEDCPGGAGEAGRGARASYWDLDAAVAAGWAVAVLHQSDVAPDDAAHLWEGVAGAAATEPERPWGAVGAWAWGLSLAARGLRDSGLIDASRLALFGHSRRGKAALLAGALDPAIGAVWAHQSGTMGATLSRSSGGESVGAITTLYPHWFTPRLAAFASRETFLPFDQHLLLALLAPRPVLVSDGADDTWADPPGAAASVELAAPVWALLGAAEQAPAHALRPGDHDVRAEDWAIFLEWAAGG